MIIPPERLSSEILFGIMKDFVLREGTDYGSHEYSLEEKLASVRKQLDSGKIFIVFDAQDETCSLVTKEELRRIEEGKKT